MSHQTVSFLTSRASKESRTLAIVLAGGQSQRMGTNKSTLMLAGKSLLERTINVAISADCEVMISIGAQPNPSFLHYLHDRLPHVNYWNDDINHGGPVGAIISVLSRLASSPLAHFDRVVFIPVDLPRLTADTLASLIMVVGKAVIAAHYDDSPLPLALALTPKLFAYNQEVKQAWPSPSNINLSAKTENARLKFSMSVKHYVNGLHPQLLPMSEACTKALFNVNTPIAWKEVAGEYPY